MAEIDQGLDQLVDFHIRRESPVCFKVSAALGVKFRDSKDDPKFREALRERVKTELLSKPFDELLERSSLAKRRMPRTRTIHLGTNNQEVRQGGWCPECKERLEECECEELGPLVLDDDGRRR